MWYAVRRDKYWIADLVAQWDRDAIETDAVKFERSSHPLCDAVIRARLAKMDAAGALFFVGVI